MNSTFAIGDLTVDRLGFGAMHITPSDPPVDRDANSAVARRAVGLGVQLIDTAYLYGHGANYSREADSATPRAAPEAAPALIRPRARRLTMGKQVGTYPRPRAMRFGADVVSYPHPVLFPQLEHV